MVREVEIDRWYDLLALPAAQCDAATELDSGAQSHDVETTLVQAE